MSEAADPTDQENRRWLGHVRPADWINPKPADRYNLVVIGAGTAGLVTAAGAAGLGARVAIVERHRMGGDCLNTGCVPSKTLLSAARVAHECGHRLDFAAVMERVRRTRADIAPHDSAARFRDLGIDVFFGEARFVGRDAIEVDGRKLAFRKAVIATGARPAVPEVPGLAEVPFLTNESVFELTRLPARLVVIGGGPIGCELAQAFQRLGSEVTILQSADRLLPRDDADAAEVVARTLSAEGVNVRTGARVGRVESAGAGRWRVDLQAAAAGNFECDAILVAAGRRPNVDGMNLAAAGINADRERGVLVDQRLRTTNRNVFAAGDVCLEQKFTHAADFAARTVIRNALFRGRKKLSNLTIPWCTYTDPELAQVGMVAAEAIGRGADVWTRAWADVDRARAENATDGFVRIVTARGSDRIIGATVVGPHAGELVNEVSVAMAAGLGLGRLAEVIHPYPTRAEAIRQLGDSFNRTRLTPMVRALFRGWLEWTR